MWRLLLLLGFLCGMQGSVLCQSLKVGDRLEGIKATKSSAKLMILDFWSINCAACIRAFPKLQDLQNHFDPDVEMVLVSRESKKTVDEFYNKRKQLQKPSLRFIYSDTALNQKFKDYAYPFQVWLDSSGKIVTITEVADISVQSIQQFLLGENIIDASARKKRLRSSLIETGMRQYKAPVLYYSYLAKCSETINVGNNRAAALGDKMVRLSEDCASVLRLYRTAYSEKGKYRLNDDFNIVLDQVNPGLIYPPADRQLQIKWDQENRYTYDLAVPKERAGDLFAMMQDDLNRHFGLSASISKGECTMIELLAKPGPNLLLSKGGVAQCETNYDTLTGTKRLRVLIRNKPFDTLVTIIRKNLPKINMDLEDRSFYSALGNIDIEIMIDLDTGSFVQSLKKTMDAYNVAVVTRSKQIDILILSRKIYRHNESITSY
jgi:thiol-disulfide isomerase/thioredoxin